MKLWRFGRWRRVRATVRLRHVESGEWRHGQADDGRSGPDEQTSSGQRWTPRPRQPESAPNLWEDDAADPQRSFTWLQRSPWDDASAAPVSAQPDPWNRPVSSVPSSAPPDSWNRPVSSAPAPADWDRHGGWGQLPGQASPADRQPPEPA